MRAAASDNEVKRFGVFEADLTAGELRRNGARVKLQEQPFQVLAALLEKPGAVVTKEELQRRIWNGDTFVDFDRSLATDISKIRHALGDSATRPRFIETVPQKGYRFIGLAPEVQDPRLTFGLPSAAIVAACLATAAMALWVALRPPTAREGPAPTLEPLTTLPGFERYPAISPDGTRVAFAWQREDDDQFDIYVKLIGLGQPRRLTSHLASELAPSWSADGGRITFTRYVDSEQIAIVQVPALGGREIELTRVADFGGPILRPRQYAWAPGEEALIVSDRKRPDGPFHLFLHPLDGSPRRELTSPSEDAIGDFDASFDRSGTMSFLRGAADGRRTLYRWDPVDVARARGEPVPVGGIPYLMYTPVLAPGGDEIVLTAWAPLPALWRVPLSHPQSPEPVLAAGQRALHPAFSADGDLLAHSTWEWDHDIWRLELQRPGVAGLPERWIHSTYDEMWPDYSPDGARIAFQSNRSGSHQIWVCDAEGRNPGRLTSIDSSFAGSPRWSPDGLRIAFDSVVETTWAVHVMSANGGGVRRVTDPKYSGVKPSWSRDGERLYFASFLEKLAGVYQVSLAGGEPELLAEGFSEIYDVDESDRYLFGIRQDRKLCRVDLASRGEECLLEGVDQFVLAREGLYYSLVGPPMKPRPILFYRFADETVEVVSRPPLSAARRFALSRDGKSLLFSQDESVNSDLMLIRDYR